MSSLSFEHDVIIDQLVDNDIMPIVHLLYMVVIGGGGVCCVFL